MEGHEKSSGPARQSDASSVIPASRWARYGFALLSVAAAFALRAAFDPVLEGRLPFQVFLLAVLLAAWHGGIGPGITALVLGWSLGDYFFEHPGGFFGPFSREKLLLVAVYLATGALIIGVVEVLRRGRRHAEIGWLGERKLSRKLQQEIALRHRAEQVLLKERNFSDAIIKSSPGIFYLFDQPGKFLRWNKNLENVSGYSAQEIARMHPVQLIAEDDRTLIAERIAEVFRAGAATFEADLRCKDGQRIAYFFTGQRVMLDEAPCLVGVGVDISERKQAEADLRESEARKAAILDTALDCIITMNEAGKVIEVNPAVEQTFGYRREEMLGRQMADLIIPPRYREAHHRGLAHYRATGQGPVLGKLIELTALRRDGTEFPVELEIRAIQQSGSVLFTGTVRDISERKAGELALRRAQEELAAHAGKLEATVAERTAQLQETVAELESFSYSLSHDMRAPLRAMLSFSEMLAMEYGEALDATGRSYLHRITSSSGRLDRLIQDVLSYSRLLREQITLHTVEVEKLLHDIIQERPNLQPPKAEISIERPLLPVLAHEAALTQCLSNLLENGVKFVVHGVQPKLRVWTQALDSKVRIWVEDNGIGIAKDAQDRIFGLFQRLHSEQIYEGTGIGLTIVRKAVQRMGGQVGLESEIGKGSKFWIELARAK